MIRFNVVRFISFDARTMLLGRNGTSSLNAKGTDARSALLGNGNDPKTALFGTKPRPKGGL